MMIWYDWKKRYCLTQKQGTSFVEREAHGNFASSLKVEERADPVESFIDFEVGEKICGLAAYTKSDKANLTQGEKNAIRIAVQMLETCYNRPAEKEE